MKTPQQFLELTYKKKREMIISILGLFSSENAKKRLIEVEFNEEYDEETIENLYIGLYKSAREVYSEDQSKNRDTQAKRIGEENSVKLVEEQELDNLLLQI